MADTQPTPTRREAASAGDLVELVKTYAKQETVGPFRNASRWIAYGAAGSACLALGLFLLLLGLLRFMQSEWGDIAQGRSSWVPYAIVFVVSVLLLVATGLRINKTYLSKDDRR